MSTAITAATARRDVWAGLFGHARRFYGIVRADSMNPSPLSFRRGVG